MAGKPRAPLRDALPGAAMYARVASAQPGRTGAATEWQTHPPGLESLRGHAPDAPHPIERERNSPIRSTGNPGESEKL